MKLYADSSIKTEGRQVKHFFKNVLTTHSFNAARSAYKNIAPYSTLGARKKVTTFGTNILKVCPASVTVIV